MAAHYSGAIVPPPRHGVMRVNALQRLAGQAFWRVYHDDDENDEDEDNADDDKDDRIFIIRLRCPPTLLRAR